MVTNTAGLVSKGSSSTPAPHHRATHITLNPYSTQLVDNLNLMMKGANFNSNSSRQNSSGSGSCGSSSGVTEEQLLPLTQTLRRQQQQRNDEQQQEQELVYGRRAVSPHGHVYWEINPAAAAATPAATAANFYLIQQQQQQQQQPLTAAAVAALEQQQPLLDHRVPNRQQLSPLPQESAPLLPQANGIGAFVRTGAGR